MQLPVARIPPAGDNWTEVARRQEVRVNAFNTGGLAATGGLILNAWTVPDQERWRVERLVVTSDYASAITCRVFAGDLSQPGVLGEYIAEIIPLTASGVLSPSYQIGAVREPFPLVFMPVTPISFAFDFSVAAAANTNIRLTARMDWTVYREVTT